MPDGTIIENVPDGITQSELMRRLQKRQQEAAPQPEEPPSVGQTLAIGAGRTFDQLAAGLKHLLPESAQRAGDRVGAALGMANGEKLADPATQSENARLYQGLREQRPFATLAGETLPLLAAPAAASGGIAAAAAASALPGLIEYGSNEERLARGALGAFGGALGAAAGKGISRALQPSRVAPDAATQAAIDAAGRIGYRVPAGQQTGSKAIQTLEQQVAKNPIGAAFARPFAEGNQKAINRAAMKAIGEAGDSVTEEAIAAAKARLGGNFESLTADKVIPLTKGFEARALALKQKADLAGPFKSQEVSALVDNALELAKSGQMTGEAYQAIRSQLTDRARQAAAASNGKLQSAIKSVRSALDDAAEKVLSAEEQALYKSTRQQYAAVKTLEKVGAVKGGNVDPAIIRNVLQRGDKSAFASGKLSGELADIARIGNAFRQLPDSGTASNAVTQLLLTGGAGLAGPGALLAALVGPAAVGKGLFSDAGRRYLTNGIMNVSPELERRLMMSGAGLLGLPAIAASGQ